MTANIYKISLRVQIFLALAVLSVLIASCTKKADKPTLWIYTSVYNHVVQDFDAKLKSKFPNINFQWYQSGSENVAAKVNSELLSGKTQADLLMTSDLFWYEDLKIRKALLAYDSPVAAKVPIQFKDPEHHWIVTRVPVMVLAYHTDVYNEKDAPKGFADLTDPKFKDKVSMGSPLESGTTFTAVALLQKKYGLDYFKKLRANGVISAGGNSAVIAKLETKERPVGIVLLENILSVQRKNPKIKAIYPSDGVLTIPSPVAITASTPHPDLARQVYDYLLSRDIQDVIVKGDVYGVFNDAPAPQGAKPWSEIMELAQPWSSELIRNVRSERDAIKQNFSKIMFE